MAKGYSPYITPCLEEPELPPPLKFWVKDREAGKVIGRGGETVREVMEKRLGAGKNEALIGGKWWF